MSYLVKAGSLTVVAINSAEALKLADSLSEQTDLPVIICDMDGRDVDPARFRRAIAELGE
jgi:hypothetical protein